MDNLQQLIAPLTLLVAALGALVVSRSKPPAQRPSTPSQAPSPTPTATPAPSVPKTKREELYAFAKLCFDEKRHCTLNDTIPKEVGCAQAVSYVLNGAGVKDVPKYGISGTYSLWDFLRAHPDFKEVEAPEYGDIILSVTGTGNGVVKNGHTGIVGKFQVMSNNSKTGIWDNHWLLDEWLKYYTQKGGMPTRFFRRVG